MRSRGHEVTLGLIIAGLSIRFPSYQRPTKVQHYLRYTGPDRSVLVVLVKFTSTHLRSGINKLGT